MPRDADPPLRRLTALPEGEVRTLRGLLAAAPLEAWLLDLERLDAAGLRDLDDGRVPSPLRAWWLAAASASPGAQLARFRRSRWGCMSVDLGPADVRSLEHALDAWAFTGAHALVWGAEEPTAPLRCSRALAPCVDGCGVAVLGYRSGWGLEPLG